MALRTEYPYKGRYDRIKHYSDEGYLILQNETDRMYVEAVDKFPCKYTYSETDEPIPATPEEENQ